MNRQKDNNTITPKNFSVQIFLNVLTLIFPGGWLPPPRDFSLSPQNQKESDLSHLSNLKYILCGHFDEKKNRGYPLQGVK